jgi:hypothetical protein
MTTDAPLRGRHRDKNGEISRKHGNTLIGTLRKLYGARFAEGFGDRDKLADALHALDEHSLSQLVHDHEQGHLEGKLAPHSAGDNAPEAAPTI